MAKPACPYCGESIERVLKPMERAGLAACGHCMNPFVYRTSGAQVSVEAPRNVQDIRQMGPPESIGGQVMRLVPRALERLPLLPEVAMEVTNLVRDPDVEIAKLADVISRDQVITVKVLKLANSAMFAGLREITDVRAAVTRIGLKNTAATVNAIAASGIFRAAEPGYVAYMRGLWRHAIAAAHCASEIAVFTAEPDTEFMYAAALVHDVGKVLLLDIIVNGRGPALDRVRESKELFSEIMASYHGLMGLHVIQHWNLPPEFAVTTYCHANPQALPDDNWLTTVSVVALGSAVANASGYGVSEKEVPLLGHPATKALGFNDIKLATFRVDLEDKLTPLFGLNEEK